MKKILLLIALFAISFQNFAQWETLWERTKDKENMPSWFSTGEEEENSHKGTERGIVYNAIEDHIYVSSRMGGEPYVRIVDPYTGDDLGELMTDGFYSEGEYTVYPLNNVQVSDDGQIFACNLALSTAEPLTDDDGGIKVNSFRVVKWEYEMALPEVIIDYAQGGYRLGDKFSVQGDFTGDAIITACPGERAVILRWTVTGGILNPDPEIVNLTDVLNAGTNTVAQHLSNTPDSKMYISGKGFVPTLFAADGTFLSATALADLEEAYNGGRILNHNSKVWMCHYACTSAAGMILDLTKVGENVTNADIYGQTPSINSALDAPGYGAGAANFAVINNEMHVWVCCPDRGIAGFKATDIDLGTNTGIADFDAKEINLSNYPNPFKTQTSINYAVPSNYNGEVMIEIFNSNGALVKDFCTNQNEGTIQFSANGLASGVYICRLKAGNVIKVNQMTMVK